MALMTKADLESRKYKYSWTTTPGDNPHITGKPDSGRVSRREGYEVLDYINALAEKWEFKKKASGLKLQDMIHSSDIVMRADLTKWIANNWKAFQS